MSPTDQYMTHIRIALQALTEAQRINADGRPLSLLAAAQNLRIAAEEAEKASRLLRLDPFFTEAP